MAQTKTDTTKRSTWWSVTAFSEVEIEQLNGSVYPAWVFKVHGGLESCPKTGRAHYQGAIQARTNVRFSAVKSWLATAHIEPAIDRFALQKYVMKEETAIGDKTVKTNETPYYRAHELLLKLALKQVTADRQTKEGWSVINAKKPGKPCYWWCVRQVCRDDKTLISAYMNPALEKAWVETSEIWIEEVVEGQLVLPAPVLSSGSIINEIIYPSPGSPQGSAYAQQAQQEETSPADRYNSYNP